MARSVRIGLPRSRRFLRQFVQASRNEVDIEFWSKNCHSLVVGGSGPSYLSGWITAFCVFDGEDNWQETKFAIPRFRSLRHSSKPELI
ncbi:hypothetical protein L7F22_029592 [Adiantum nelumboides]|nr:hypothetical protein [Adiantum nelumboides]